MHLLQDLSNYIQRLPESSKSKVGVQLLERSLIAIVDLYQVADVAFAVSVSEGEKKKELIEELDKVVTEYFARLNDN